MGTPIAAYTATGISATYTATGGSAAAISPCDTPATTALERTRFFPRQLIGPDDLTQDQIYFREKLRRHNRMLHGWGVVCGIGVRNGATSCEVVVAPGYILGPFGDEIVIDQPTTFDVCKQSAGQSMGCCGQELDPWCADVRANCNAGTLYLAVRYQECQARPVQTGTCGCGCDDSTCQYSRTRDSFALTLLDALPAGYATPMPDPLTGALAPCMAAPNGVVGRACPPCPTSPWVIIADLTVGTDCTITGIDCFAHRRYVVSWGNYYELCRLQSTHGSFQPAPDPPLPPAPPPAAPPPGQAPAPAKARIQPLAGAAPAPAPAPPAPPSPPPAPASTSAPAGVSTPAVTMIDLGAVGDTQAPRATVSLTRGDGTTAVIPANFTVQPDDTVATLLAREGTRQYQDPTTGSAFTLADLYANAGVAPSTAVPNTGSALGLLEGHLLDIDALRASRETLGGLLQPTAVTEFTATMEGSPSLATTLSASSLIAAGTDSTLVAKLGKRTIGTVAAMPRDQFIDSMLTDTSTKKRAAVRQWAGAVWDAATSASHAAAAG